MKSQQCLVQDFEGFSGYRNSHLQDRLGEPGGESVLTKGDMRCIQAVCETGAGLENIDGL